MKEKLSTTWLFQEHSKTTICRWAGQFRYFYYKRALGGVGHDMRQSPDGDAFIAGIQVVDTEDLKRKSAQLDINLEVVDEGVPVYQRLHTYPEFKKIPSFIERFDRQIYFTVRNGFIEFEVIGLKNSYVVAEEDADYALKLEQYFDELGWQQEKEYGIREKRNLHFELSLSGSVFVSGLRFSEQYFQLIANRY